MVTIALDAAFDLNEGGTCACDECCETYREDYRIAAEVVSLNDDIEIEVVDCIYGSPESYDCDGTDQAREIWQECHDLTPTPRHT